MGSRPPGNSQVIIAVKQIADARSIAPRTWALGQLAMGDVACGRFVRHQ